MPEGEMTKPRNRLYRRRSRVRAAARELRQDKQRVEILNSNDTFNGHDILRFYII